MQRDSDHSTESLDPAWEKACIEILRGNRKGVDLYRSRTIKERLMDAMAWPNTSALVKAAKGTGRMTLRDVAGRLCLDDRTLERWQKGVVQPHPRTFFGLLYVGLRKEVVDVAYPDSRDVLWDAVIATLRMNRAKELRQRTRRPRRDEFVLVRQLMRHPRADVSARASVDGGRDRARAHPGDHGSPRSGRRAEPRESGRGVVRDRRLGLAVRALPLRAPVRAGRRPGGAR